MRRLAPAALLFALACSIRHAESGRPPGTTSDADSLLGVEQDSTTRAEVDAALRAWYERLSARDWRAVRAGFWPGGTIATRVVSANGREERVSVQTLEQFTRRAEGPGGPGRLAVFSERMLHATITGYGDVADAWVVSEGRWGRTRDSVKTTRGVDAFHLYRDNGSWRIVSLTSTPEVAARPIRTPPRRPAASRSRPRSSRRGRAAP